MTKICFKDKVLYRRLLYTLLVIALFRFGCALTVPFVDLSQFSNVFAEYQMLSYLNLVSGGALENMSVFAIGISASIQTSCLLFFAQMIYPPFQERMRTDKKGQKNIIGILRTVLSFSMSLSAYAALRSYGALVYDTGIEGFFAAMVIVFLFAAGAQVSVLLAKQIDCYGLGNGTSVILFVGIVSQRTQFIAFWNTFVLALQSRDMASIVGVVLIIAIIIASTILIVVMHGAEQKIAVHYSTKAKAQLNAYIPIKFMSGGAMPLIYASIMLSLFWAIVQNIVNHISWLQHAPIVLQNAFLTNSWLYCLVYLFFIFYYQQFFTEVQLDTTIISNYLRRNGGVLAQVRAGEETVDYLNKTVRFCTLVGSAMLSLIALLPIVAEQVIGISFPITGTSLLLVCSIIMEVIKEIRSYQLISQQSRILI